MDILIGKVTHYYNRISVAVVELAGELQVRRANRYPWAYHRVHPAGRSLEIEHHMIESARSGTGSGAESLGGGSRR